MTHSPAPWHIGGSVDWTSYGEDVIISYDRQEVCKEVFNRSDAALIAASPDLLAAAKKVLFVTGSLKAGFDIDESVFEHVRKELQAAISKAEPSEINET